jgi:polyphosphate kinase 2 (PPK2 family)
LEDVERRYDQINAFEKHLSENGTRIVKFMLNIGYEEQGIRLKERLLEEHKLWKFNPGDLDDRSKWSEFMAAYELAVRRCSTRHAPWFIVPADSRTRRNAIIARIVRGALEEMDLSWKDPGYSPESFDFS